MSVGTPVKTGLFFTCVCIPLFAVLCNVRPGYEMSDHAAHLHVAQQLVVEGVTPPHPLYHIVIATIAGLSTNWAGLLVSAVVVLSMSCGARVGIYAQRLAQPLWITVLFCALLLLAAPFPNWWRGEIYRGQLSPNVWHNPTAIFASPLCLLAFYQSLKSQAPWNLFLTGALLAVGATAKPNYLLAFAPAFCIALTTSGLVADSSLRDFLKKVGALLVLPGLVLAAQFYLLRSVDGQGGIIVAPCKVWGHYSPNIPASLLLSIAFPLLTAVAYPKLLATEQGLHLAWTTFGIAVLQFVFLAESGEKFTHGNFGWGAMLANQLLFVESARIVLLQPLSHRKSVCLTALWLHAIAGAWFLWQCLELAQAGRLY